MKRVILAAAFIVAISGFAAAQSTSAKTVTQPQKATVKKGPTVKTNNKNTVLKQETSSTAKSDSSEKLLLPMPRLSSDTAAMPAVRSKQEL